MKILPALLTFLLLTSAGFAQQKDITVFEKKEGNKNIVMARNTGKVPYSVTVSITAEGMDVTPGLKAEAIIPAGFIKQMATLVPRAGEAWSYSYTVSYMEYIDKNPKTSSTPSVDDGLTPVASPPEPTPTPQEALSDASIMLYTKAGCGRCTTVKKEMNDKGISYEEVNIQNPSPEVTNMWSQLRESGFTGNSVTLPVVRVNGKYHYNIKDLMGFVSNLKS